MKSAKILIVEDDSNIAFLTKEMLSRLGHKVLDIVTSDEKAIKYLEEQKPDLILMDILIEGERDGIETSIEIKNRFSVPVIFVTAYAENHFLERSKDADPFGYLVKPYKLKDLKSTIEIALQRIEFENKLKESESWFKSTLNSIGNGIIATDPNDRIKYMNRSAEKLTGYSAEQIIGKPLRSVYRTYADKSPEGLIYLLSQDIPDFKEAIKNNKILVSKNGQKISIEETDSIIRNLDGETVGKVVTIRDLTSNRKMQLASLAAKEYYLNIFEKFPVLIWRSNKQGLFNYFNKSWLDFTGMEMDSSIYDRWYNAIHPDDRQSFIELFEKSLKNQEKFEIEIRLLASDKEYHWLICIGNPLYDLKENFNGFIGVNLDITNRKVLEDELRQAKIVSDSSNKSKSRFITNMSHEIRTPLNGIMGLTDLLFDTELKDEQFEFISLIKQSSHTLLQLLNNLLDYSKIEDKREKIKETKFNLENIIDEILKPYQSVAKRSGVKIDYEFDSEIPDELIGDSGKIKQILANLISNAFKFTQKGFVKLKVEIDKLCSVSNHAAEGLLLHFMISDTGIGIPKEKFDIIFESFMQVDGSLTRKYSGSGLGLAIVKSLVELMNGRIWFESEAGKGTKFHFVLELKKLSKQMNNEMVA